ncbi:P-loop containing nucleoside triphosphate hydrolase protein [Aspergillus undulatus]|uniref:P-loop containing nucleoside triphosphate hydrolase protein n=1 Tax=Aspergillus undulatus TaxID=1810928 RepID=UPI003CCD5164
MEQFYLDNIERYQTLVGRFKPPRVKEPAKTDVQTNPNVVVATRIRPLSAEETKSGQVPGVFRRAGEDGTVDLFELRRLVRGLPTLNPHCFRSDKTYHPDQTTETIYYDIVKPLLPWVLQGRVGTLFAYGQTGSGKAFTVSGLERLIASSIFEGVQATQRVRISFIELAGNSGYDLLNNRAPFQILEDAHGETQLAGALEAHVSSPEQLLQLIEKAATFRQTAPTAKNDGSSRSHAICKIRIEDTSLANPDGVLYMIDLAGSEAARGIADHSADRMKETREVNVSLATLKDCIRAMSLMDLSSGAAKKGTKTYIPYRHSALTKVLKHLFDPDSNQNCKTVILACISPSFLDVGASKNTLRYAQMLRVALPKTKAKATQYDPTVPSTWSNKDVKNYIKLQSGYPAITSYDLAPKESGAQLLRLPVDEFVKRCLNTPDVTEEQAKAFHAKLWALHVKSQRNNTP